MSALTATSGALSQLRGQAESLGGIFQRMAAPFNQFTQALNPSVVQALGRAFHDMNAVIGIVAQEITAAFIPVVRAVSSMMIPLMKQLAPMISLIANTLGVLLTAALRPIIMAMTNWFKLIQPFVEIFYKMLSMLQGFSAIMSVFQATIGAVINVIVAFIKSLGIEKMADLAVKVVKSFTQALILATVALLKFIGANDAIRSLLEATDPNKAVGMGVHPAQYKSIENVGKDVYLRAFQAGLGGEKQKKPEDWLGEIHGQIQDMMNKDPMSVLKDFAAQTSIQIASEFTKMMPQWGVQIAQAVAQAIRNIMPALPGGGVRLPKAPPVVVPPRGIGPGAIGDFIGQFLK